jgi:hypothetical protein
MAFRDTATDPSFVRNLPKNPDNLFFNTKGFVAAPALPAPGHIGPKNAVSDVMLVQHFLKVIALNPGKFSRPFKPPKNFPSLKVDGVVGPATLTWIAAFQQHLVAIGRPVLADGVVDSVTNGGALTARGHVLTLELLNVTMGQVTGDELWDQWWLEPGVPALLRSQVQNPAGFL